MNLGSLIPWREKSRPVARADRDPFSPVQRELEAFRREVDRVFDDFFIGGWPSRSFDLSPSVDVTEEDKHIVVWAEIPGLDEEDLDITVAGDVLTIRGEKKGQTENREGNSRYIERRFGSFARSIQLPFDIGGDIDATYAKGVLTIRLPKPADAQREPRRIEVKTS